MKTAGKITAWAVGITIIAGITYKLVDVKRNQQNEIELVKQSKSEVPVAVVRAEYGDVTHDIAYHGTFEPICQVTVVSETQGKVTSDDIEEGECVQEGKILAPLENDLISYQLENAEITYNKAKNDLQRLERLTPGEAVSTQQLDDAKLALSNTKSAFLTLKKQYDQSFIKAPISGIVAKKYFEKGSFIMPGIPVADIVDTRKMKFIAWLKATDLVQVKVGLFATISTDLYPGTTYPGVIKTIGLQPDESKRYRVQLEVQNSSTQPLIPGIDGLMTIGLKPDKHCMVIPRNCIVGSVIDPEIYLVENGLAKLHKVTIAKMVNNQVFISDGLNPGEQVVLSGQINLENNTPVRVTDNRN